MNETAPRSPVFAPPLPAPPIQWRRCGRALGELIRDPDATEKVFELIDATGGRGDEATVQCFASHREGRRLLAERPSLLERLADRAALAALPRESLGRAYLAFARRNGFAADGVLEARNRGIGALDARIDADRQWFFERLNLMHDVWHVLTGYDTDPAGEAALLAFSIAQGVSSWTLRLLSGTAVVLGARSGGLAFPRFLLQARRRGRRAAPLLVQRYEELLPRPLEEVGRELRIQPLREAHPSWVLRAEGGLDRCERVAT